MISDGQKKRRLTPPIMGEEKIYVIIVPAVCAAYTRDGKIFPFFFSILTTGGGIVAQEEESREFHSLLYSKQAVVTVAAIVLALIIFAIWE